MNDTSLPKVSICFITYNQIHYVEQAIRSALDQDYPYLEIVVADDGSTDGTAKLLQSIAESDLRLKVIADGSNLGITGNSNRALSHATGDYLCLIGGDDILVPGKIRRQVAFMQQHPEAALSYHEAEVFDSDTGKRLFYFSQGQIHEGDASKVIKYPFICAGTVMMRRQNFPKSGFDNDVPVASDWPMWINILATSGLQILYMPGVYLRYRQHSRSAMQQMRGKLPNFREHVVTLSKAKRDYPQYLEAVRYKETELLLTYYLMALVQHRRPKEDDIRGLAFHMRFVPEATRNILAQQRLLRQKRFQSTS